MSHEAIQTSLPIAGRSPRRRHASHSGAVRASKDRGALSAAMLNLLRAVGPQGLSDHEMATALARPLSSMNSCRNGLGDLIEESGNYELTDFGTQRTRWRVRQ